MVEVWYTQCTQVEVWYTQCTPVKGWDVHTMYTQCAQGMSWEPDVGKGDALTLATGLSLY